MSCIRLSALLLLALVLVVIYSCGDKSKNQPCTTEACAGLNITVRNSLSGVLLFDSVVVVATDGAYTETLTAYDPSNPIFSGAYEREGNYTISVNRPRYKPYTYTSIIVQKDACHVMAQQYTVNLLPN